MSPAALCHLAGVMSVVALSELGGVHNVGRLVTQGEAPGTGVVAVTNL